MNILVISAYPNHTGFNYTITRTILKNLNKGHDITALDLYELNFDPVLKFDTLHRRRDLGTDILTKEYRELVKEAEFLIFIYPIWWGGMPAILKGFIDRIFVQGFAYKYKGIFPVPLLNHKQAWIVNTNDTPHIYANLFQQDYGKILKNQVLKMCGIKTIKHSQLYFVRSSTNKQRENFLHKVALFSKSI